MSISPSITYLSSSLSPRPYRRPYMARSLHKTLTVLSSKTSLSIPQPLSSSRRVTLRAHSTQSESADIEREALAVQKIEEAIHGIIVRRSAPDWLPFVPGSSYWVPPRKGTFGIADLAEKLANSLTEEEVMSLTTTRGWPASALFVNNEKTHVEDEEN